VSDSDSALRSRRETLVTLERNLAARSARLSGLRGVLFLVAVAALIYALTRDVPPYVLALVVLAWVVFVAVVVVHGALVARETEAQSRIGIVDRWLSRAADKPPEPLPDSPSADPTHPYAVDLDVFGASSVFQLVDDTRTAPGTSTLSMWLSMRAPPEEIASRQQAVRELSTRVQFREDLAALGVAGGARGRSVEPLVSWAETPLVLGAGFDRALVRAAFVLVPLTFVLFAVRAIWGDAAPELVRRAWYVPFGLQLVVLFWVGRKVAPVLAKAASKESPFGRYRSMFARIEAEPFETSRLQSLRESLGVGKDTRTASQELDSFERILGFVELRHSGLVHLLANILLLWDVFCGFALEHFRARAGKHVRGWFKSLGEIEALSSLGGFAYEHPTYAYPVVEDGPPQFFVENLGHPLIPSGRRVVNSMQLSGAGGIRCS
jgi:hypothetical protein